MTNNLAGISSYNQANQLWNTNQPNATEKSAQSDIAAKKAELDNNSYKAYSDSKVKVSEWKGLAATSVLVPTNKDGYGTVVGNAQLSDKAKNYYDQLKNKFHGMDFILVSKDVKSQVQANASAYGNANKPVVLISDEEVEKMANDEAYRNKYEGIITMAQTKLEEAKNSLLSSGASVKNFGMTVDSDGRTSFFATIDKANEASRKVIEKRQAAKKEAKAKEQKKAEKEASVERLEKRREANRADQKDRAERSEKADGIDKDDREYLEFQSDSLDDLLKRVSTYVYDNSARNVMTQAESMLGQSIDFKG